MVSTNFNRRNINKWNIYRKIKRNVWIELRLTKTNGRSRKKKQDFSCVIIISFGVTFHNLKYIKRRQLHK